MRRVVVDEGFLSTLEKEPYRASEDNFVENGSLGSCFPWADVLAGGHCRYVICKGHKVPFDAARMRRNALFTRR